MCQLELEKEISVESFACQIVLTEKKITDQFLFSHFKGWLIAIWARARALRCDSTFSINWLKLSGSFFNASRFASQSTRMWSMERNDTNEIKCWFLSCIGKGLRNVRSGWAIRMKQEKLFGFITSSCRLISMSGWHLTNHSMSVCECSNGHQLVGLFSAIPDPKKKRASNRKENYDWRQVKNAEFEKKNFTCERVVKQVWLKYSLGWLRMFSLLYYFFLLHHLFKVRARRESSN